MADISKIQIESGTYDIKDTTARNGINSLNNTVDTLNNDLYDFPQMQVKSFAHRGLSCCAPENTIASIIKAGVHKCYGVEIDVQTTVDNEIVVIHDDTVDRTTNGTGTVNELTYAYISSLNIDTGNYLSNLPTQKVPLLSNALKYCNKYNLVPQLELKGSWSEANLQNLINLIKGCNLERIAIIISFNYSYLQIIRNLNNKIKLALLTGETLTDSIIDTAIGLGKCGISMSLSNNTTVSQTFKTKMANNNIPYGFWTVNSTGDAVDQLLRNNGTSFLVSDYAYGQMANFPKRMIGVTTDGTIKSWNSYSNGANYISYYYEDFTVTSLSNNEYKLAYSIPLYYDTLGYVGCPMMHLEGDGAQKYYITVRGQNDEGFTFRIIRVSDGATVTIPQVISDIGTKYITITA